MADGTFSYTHNGSEKIFTDSFTYQVCDGALLSNVATVTITITPVNDVPVVARAAPSPTRKTTRPPWCTPA